MICGLCECRGHEVLQITLEKSELLNMKTFSSPGEINSYLPERLEWVLFNKKVIFCYSMEPPSPKSPTLLSILSK